MRIFKLTSDVNFQGLRRVSEKWKETIFWFLGESRAEGWKAPDYRVIYNPYEAEKPRGDFPYASLQGIFLTAHAKRIMMPLLLRAGEYLPIECDEVPGGLELFNATVVLLDALDEANIEATRFNDGNLVTIKKFAFHKDAVQGHPIFRIAQQRGGLYVTDVFTDFVEQHGLTGLAFELVWGDDKDFQIAASARAQAKAAQPTTIPVNEFPLNEEDKDLIQGTLEEGYDLLELSGTEAPAEIVKQIAAQVDALRKIKLEHDEETQQAAILGVLFGEQLKKAYGWDWCQIETASRRVMAVVASDKSLYLEPLHFVWQFLIDTTQDQTIILTFNMLAKQKTSAKPGDYKYVS